MKRDIALATAFYVAIMGTLITFVALYWQQSPLYNAIMCLVAGSVLTYSYISTLRDIKRHYRKSHMMANKR